MACYVVIRVSCVWCCLRLTVLVLARSSGGSVAGSGGCPAPVLSTIILASAATVLLCLIQGCCGGCVWLPGHRTTLAVIHPGQHPFQRIYAICGAPALCGLLHVGPSNTPGSLRLFVSVACTPSAAAGCWILFGPCACAHGVCVTAAVADCARSVGSGMAECTGPCVAEVFGVLVWAVVYSLV